MLALAGTTIGTAATAGNAAPAAAATLVVHANQPFRPVTHVGSGGLYGLDTASVPADNLVQALHPNTFVQMAPGGQQLPNGEPGPGGDALVVAPEAARAGARVVVRMPDWYPNFPYRWVSWNDWLSAVDKQVAAVGSSGAGNISAWEPWNEPDWTWNTNAAGSFDAGWARTCHEVRSKDQTRPIQGPSLSHFDINWLRTFLTDARNTGTLPDVVSWHELGGSASIPGDVAALQSLEAGLGISPRPIAIEEYATTGEVGVPGSLVGYLAKFERAGVNNAELAFWNQYGTLGDTLVSTGGAPNGAYWLYDWYGAMTGNMVTTVPPGPTGLDGAASVSADGSGVSVIFGGGSGATAVTVDGLGGLPALGGTVNVTLEYTPSPGRTTPVSAPVTISRNTYPVVNGAITVPVSMSASDGYHLVITPGGGSTTLAGRYQISNGNSGLVLDTRDGGTGQGTGVVQSTQNNSVTQVWTLVPESGGLYQIQNGASGLVLGITNESTTDGGTALVWGDNGTPDHLWRFVPTGGGQYKIVNYHSGLLLGVTNESTASGAQVLQWEDNGTPDHLWVLTPR
ncbi:RICIN domain-containing protein [Solihabitans fulvus]|uniref:RICIN domain-containing protein n=1 Tax=Solihabitans fulvus TaxID=1892852 RepID=UPI001CB76773|nr:RICIN domain-containing protein [Solihabitans fulvus]